MKYFTNFLLLLLTVSVFNIYSMENSKPNCYGVSLTLDEIYLRNIAARNIRINRQYLHEEDAKIITTSFFAKQEKMIDAELLKNLLRNIQKRYSEPSVYDLCRVQIDKINRTLVSSNASGTTSV